MKKYISLILLLLFISINCTAQNIVSLDTTHWEINANAYVIENYQDEDAIYIQGGMATLKDTKFVNGTIEFDIYLTERRSFPGIRFRAVDNNMESFYFRPELSGKPDANQALSVINGLSAWQLYFGSPYSFPYDYKFNTWTHVKFVINGKKAQIFLDYSEKPQLSWHLKLEPKEGSIRIGGSFGAVYYANFKVEKGLPEIKDFEVNKIEPIKGIISNWNISDAFDEKMLNDYSKLSSLIKNRKWIGSIEVEENNVANISWVAKRPSAGLNTVFAKITIESDKDQVKLFEFGYSDRVFAILNDKTIYKGTNQYRSRDYRYLGTVGLFDAIYLNLKKGKNTLLFAVSESFGGWGITGKFENEEGLKIN